MEIKSEYPEEDKICKEYGLKPLYSAILPNTHLYCWLSDNQWLDIRHCLTSEYFRVTFIKQDLVNIYSHLLLEKFKKLEDACKRLVEVENQIKESGYVSRKE